MDLLRWGFVASYMILSVCMSLILIHTTIDSDKWTTNVVIDAILCVIFLVYCRWIHIKAVRNLSCYIFSSGIALT